MCGLSRPHWQGLCVGAADTDQQGARGSSPRVRLFSRGRVRHRHQRPLPKARLAAALAPQRRCK